MSAAAGSHARLMDDVYRRQRHIYDATRKFYLLGRDGLIAGLDAPEGGSVLEIGCGTGRNLVLAARRYPSARLHGLDISAEMLASAEASLAGFRDRVTLARGDAAGFDPAAAFGRPAFDRVFLSYTLSMIPPWREALAHAATLVAPGGSLHVVDFGDQSGLPLGFRSGLRAWLRRFHVEPRADLAETMETIAARHGAAFEGSPIFRGYAWTGTMRFAGSRQ